ncbi:inovirus-type Gp2 protein [Mangrovibacter sp. SLW1]
MSCSWLTKERLEYAIKKWGLYMLNISKNRTSFPKGCAGIPCLLAVRIDLRFPGDASIPVKTDANTITRMMKSLDEKIKANGKRRQKKGIRVYPCRIRFVWVREFGKKGNRHYHVLLLLNKDAYYHPGDYRKNRLWRI